mmetsp:Transcript_33811/g.55091  ORF Transcript_33811/g.55091 Transcript_33811/m.55091 type:complete len:96 (-) Transcript_33811:347-634(-)
MHSNTNHYLGTPSAISWFWGAQKQMMCKNFSFVAAMYPLFITHVTTPFLHEKIMHADDASFASPRLFLFICGVVCVITGLFWIELASHESYLETK